MKNTTTISKRKAAQLEREIESVLNIIKKNAPGFISKMRGTKDTAVREGYRRQEPDYYKIVSEGVNGRSIWSVCHEHEATRFETRAEAEFVRLHRLGATAPCFRVVRIKP